MLIINSFIEKSINRHVRNTTRTLPNLFQYASDAILRKVLPQKTELIVTRYLPDEVLNEGSDKGIIGIPIKILLLPALKGYTFVKYR